MAIKEFALIIGAMKCGTTSLFRHLAQHPQIAASTPKELHYFSRDDLYNRGWEWYLSRWNWDPGRHKIALEASPSYTAMPGRPNAAVRIKKTTASFRFIYLMRDPIERVESHFAHAVRQGKMRELTGDVPADWIARSKYAMQIGAFHECFPAERILLLHFDDLRRRPDELVRRVCRFLEVDHDFALKGLGTAHNVSRRDHPAYSRLTRSAVARMMARLIPLRFKQGIRNALTKKLDVDTRLSAAQRQFVARELVDDVKRLRDTYGFDISRWSIGSELEFG